MKIVADENIPLLEPFFGKNHELILKSGRAISADDVKDADILLVRSVTKVDEKLLAGSSVRFVGSTTTGFDHIDTPFLDAHHIQWAVAKGCNAQAVVEYVICVIAALQNKNFLSGAHLKAAVIGVGEIGSQVSQFLRKLGWQVLECDPFRARDEKDFPGVTLDQIQDVDFISIHTPLTRKGEYPTYHMIEKNFLQKQKKGAILLNTARGSVIDFNDLKKHGTHLHWCLDVWENEPDIDLDVLKTAMIATPHIAGYSIESKYRGMEMIYHEMIDRKILSSTANEVVIYPEHELSENFSTDWRQNALAYFDPFQSTNEMKLAIFQQHQKFDILRKSFSNRHEFLISLNL